MRRLFLSIPLLRILRVLSSACWTGWSACAVEQSLFFFFLHPLFHVLQILCITSGNTATNPNTTPRPE
jgi:hypothetical protein